MAKVVRRAAAKEKPEGERKWVSHNFEFKFITSIKVLENGQPVHGAPTWEEIQREIKEHLLKKYPNGRFSSAGGYILINGRACYPHEFDYSTMDRMPGTRPPLYTLTREEQEELKVLDRIKGERDRELSTGNSLATNPTHLLTASESLKLRKMRENKPSAPAKRPVRVKSGSGIARTSSGKQVTVEWSEKDAGNEDLVTAETEKLLDGELFKPRRVKVRRKA